MHTIHDFRRSKDQFFETQAQSPLTQAQRQDFNGLAYYDEEPDLRLEVELKPFADEEPITMQTSTGDFQEYVRYGRFSFEVDGATAELTIYSGQHGYFLPFVDSEAGKETYGAGRYLEPEQLPNGRFLVDFNYAYNPYCAYNELYSCPIPPAENRLKVPVRAGEKNFKA